MGIIFSTRKSKANINTEIESKNKKLIFTTMRSAKAVGHSSKAVISGNLLFCSGKLGLDPKTMKLVKGGIENETRQSCRNIASLLEENKISLKNVVKTTIYLKNISDLNIVEEIYKDYFVLKPARTIVGINELEKGANIKIEVIAEIK